MNNLSSGLLALTDNQRFKNLLARLQAVADGRRRMGRPRIRAAPPQPSEEKEARRGAG